jgi:hypothetical protein
MFIFHLLINKRAHLSKCRMPPLSIIVYFEVSSQLTVASPAKVGPVKPGRNEQRVRQRYLRMGKEVLVECLITAERTLAAQRERWLAQQDEALIWRLRAEVAETQLRERQAKTDQQHS